MNKNIHLSRVFITLAAVGGSASLLAASFSFPDSFQPAVEYSAGSSLDQNQTDGEKKVPAVTHLRTPKPLRALYMSSWMAGTTTNRRDELIKLVEATEINALVIDIKDSTGRIAFMVTDSQLTEIGSAEARISDLRSLIDFLHHKNIYLIGRVVVFQDPYLAAKRPDLAVKRADGEVVWRDHKGLKWLDPASREVWDYTVAIGREAAKSGFDELNFDYIRFPSDGNMDDISFPFFDPASQTKAAVLKDFFAYLSEELTDTGVPLSADLFGMTTTNTDDLNIGQVLEEAAPYFDYLSPMVYPSHYPTGFLNYKNPAAMPYEVIKYSLDEASKRLLAASSTPSKLRPWLQDFHLGATYTASMIRKEKQAVYDAGGDSWMLWSSSNRYTVGALDKSL